MSTTPEYPENFDEEVLALGDQLVGEILGAAERHDILSADLTTAFIHIAQLLLDNASAGSI